MIMNSYATFHASDLWIHIWIHVYEEYHEIIPDIMCTKAPDGHWLGRGPVPKALRLVPTRNQINTDSPGCRCRRGRRGGLRLALTLSESVPTDDIYCAFYPSPMCPLRILAKSTILALANPCESPLANPCESLQKLAKPWIAKAC